MDIEKLLQDEEFKAQLGAAKSLTEVVEILKAKGIETTEKELEEAYAQTQNQDGELGESALENVAGGRFSWLPILPILPLIPGPIWPIWRR